MDLRLYFTSPQENHIKREREAISFIAQILHDIGGDDGSRLDSLEGWLYRLRKKLLPNDPGVHAKHLQTEALQKVQFAKTEAARRLRLFSNTANPSDNRQERMARHQTQNSESLPRAKKARS